MPFDISTAKPVESGGFDLSTAKPVSDSAPVQFPIKIGKDRFADDLRETLRDTNWATRNIAGAGTALSNLVYGAKQVAGDVYDSMRQPTLSEVITGKKKTINDSEKIANNRIIADEAPVGAVAGNVALLAPTAAIPGANTYTGAATIGAIHNALQPVVGNESRTKNAMIGGGAGMAGKGLGDLAGYWLNKGRELLLAKQAQNASRDETLAAGRGLGYVVPPAEVNPTALNQIIGGLSGKVKTQQAVSERNQSVTNTAAKRVLGIPDDAPLTADAINAARETAGKSYADVANLGKFPVSGDVPAGIKTTVLQQEQPSSLNVSLGAAKKPAEQKVVDAKDMVEAWKQANFDAKAYYKAYGRDANPETLAKAKAAEAAAKNIDDFMSSQLDKMGLSDMAGAIKDARVQIAKAHTVDRAFNESTGNVDASVLKRILDKGGKLSGELETSARMAQAFPKSMQTLKESPGQVSPLDVGLAFATGNPTLLAARPLARNMLMSSPYQRLMANPSYQTNALLRAVGSPIVRSTLPGVGAGLAAQPGL